MPARLPGAHFARPANERVALLASLSIVVKGSGMSARFLSINGVTMVGAMFARYARLYPQLSPPF